MLLICISEVFFRKEKKHLFTDIKKRISIGLILGKTKLFLKTLRKQKERIGCNSTFEVCESNFIIVDVIKIYRYSFPLVNWLAKIP